MGWKQQGGVIAALAILIAGHPAFADPVSAQTVAGPASSNSFVAADFKVPTLVETPGFKIVPLGPELVDIDFAAYMSSIEHLQQTFTRSTSWPHKDVSSADAMKDMQTEQARFEKRTSFAYAVLTPDGSRERGCVYVYPSEVEGYDAVVTMWVTKAEYDAGFDAELYAWARAWVARDWPFAKVAYPGRSIDWPTWDAKVAASKGVPNSAFP
ncbi:twin-arginine translocation pathway signal protein [Blastomonas sp.]|uniref:twin-arginine translocation pathway signal protein n=1 Tax=Blastomonas sp. TaxID=1909299 RepID=UPI00262F0BCF|nr:twin-arginine translocation pathway signal protein [Blastomonas sp.]MDM7955504.1 twin-arginine translocation pathway signal protein [Blastomonas sp.]